MLEGLTSWFINRLSGARCFACHRMFLLHTPWQTYHCNRTPLSISITPEAEALTKELSRAEIEKYLAS
jgi:hypothetical protein